MSFEVSTANANCRWQDGITTATADQSMTALCTYDDENTSQVISAAEVGREYLRGDGTKYPVLDARQWVLRLEGLEPTLVTQACDEEKYEHNFDAGQSYLRTYTHYLNSGGDEVIVQACEGDVTMVFAHRYENCGFTNDDAILRSTVKQSTFIDTTDGRVGITPCTVTSETVNYAFVRSFSESHAGSINSVNWSDPMNTLYYTSSGVCKWRASSTYLLVSGQVGNPGTAISDVGADCGSRSQNVLRTTTANATGLFYRRGDSTEYKKVEEIRWTKHITGELKPVGR